MNATRPDQYPVTLNHKPHNRTGKRKNPTGKTRARLSELIAIGRASFLTGLPVIFCGLLLTFNAQAEIRGLLAPMSENLRSVMLRNPIRIVRGEHHDIAKLFAWVKAGGNPSRPSPDWFALYGTVVQVLDDGLLVRAFEDKWKGENQAIFLRNYPGSERAVDGSTVAAIVTKTGRYQYTTTAGASATVEEYDYGKLPSPEELAEYKRRNAEKLERLRTELATVQAEIRADNERKQREQTSRVVSYQLDRASNGYPSFQYELGKRYLNGDGVPQNKKLAKFWLESACTNGLSEATNLLAKLPSVAEIVSEP